MTATIDPELLKTFLDVLEHGRIAAAARASHLSQPAVSARVRRLEESLGTPLLTRSVRGVTPTLAGQRLASYARELQALLERAAADVGSTGQLGTLAIIASTTIAEQVLPITLATYRRRFPQVDLRLKIGNTEEVTESVRSGDFPIGLVEGGRRVAAVRLQPWVDDELRLVSGIDAPGGWRPRSVADLSEIPLLWRESGSGTRAMVARSLRSAGGRGKPQRGDLVLGSNEAIVSGAAAGLGLAFVSRWTLPPHVAAGRVRLVPGFELTIRRTFHWAIPSGGLSGTAAHFMQFASENPPRP